MSILALKRVQTCRKKESFILHAFNFQDRVLVEASYNPNMPFKWNATRIQVLPNQRAGGGPGVPQAGQPPPQTNQPPPQNQPPPGMGNNLNNLAFGNARGGPGGGGPGPNPGPGLLVACRNTARPKIGKAASAYQP